MKADKKALFLLLIIFCIPTFTQAQDTSKFDFRRNIIKYNATNAILFGIKNVVLSYERVIKPSQSWSVSLGYRPFPEIVNIDDELAMENERKSGGFSIHADYRFYFSKRNTKSAPDGLYWGPFVSYLQVGATNNYLFYEGDVVKDQIEIKTMLYIPMAGVKLGYQFIIGNHFSIDLELLGPAYGMYAVKFEALNQIDPTIDNEYLKILVERLISKYPGVGEFMEDKEYEYKNSITTSTLGFNYAIRLGYVF